MKDNAGSKLMDELRAYMIKKGVTLKEVAVKSGLNLNTLSTYLADVDATPGKKFWIKLKNFLDAENNASLVQGQETVYMKMLICILKFLSSDAREEVLNYALSRALKDKGTWSDQRLIEFEKSLA